MADRGIRLVVKVGTSTLTDKSGRIDRAFIADMAASLSAQLEAGSEVLVVTSGAIRAGRERLEASFSQRSYLNRSQPSDFQTTLPFKQASAAIGQGLLIHTYSEAFAWRGVDCAQILLTRDDLADRKRFLNARNTLLALLTLGVVPIINENDTVAVDEIKFGDNDMLAALVAALVEADMLLILSDVEGLYQKLPSEESSDHTAIPIACVPIITEEIESLAGISKSGVGTGGMRTKVEAAKVATEAGIKTVIARGRRLHVIEDVMAGLEIGTTFLPRNDSERLPARKRWIAHNARPKGEVIVNLCAKAKLVEESVSLLAVGLIAVNGSFVSGDLIEVKDENGEIFARGLSNYASSEVQRVLGLKSEQLEQALGYRGFEEIIHRDNLVIDR